MDSFQERAITALERGHSVLVCAPTGTGKTLVADWIVERALQTGRQVIYTAPIKALSNQKFRDYVRLYGEAAVGLVTGDQVIRRDAPCLVMTTEILRNILLAGEALPDLLAVVLDEIHFLDDRERGTVWEEVLIYLPQAVTVVGLSATLANVTEFAAWLRHVRQREVEVVEEHQRAVPLDLHYFSSDTGMLDPAKYDRAWKKRGGRPQSNEGRGRGRFRGRAGGKKTTHVQVFHALDERDWLPYLYFVFSRRDTEVLARSLARALPTSLLDPDERVRSEVRLSAASAALGPALDDDLLDLYRMGIAFHHAGLHVQLKNLVEELYEAKLIKVLYCTSTFALGINMPARSVVFDGLKKFDGRALTPLTTRGFMQKAGRAGRRGMDETGHVVVRMDLEEYPELKPILERYAGGKYEPVRSSFNLSFNSIVSLLERHDHERIREIVDKSFLTWHASYKRMAEPSEPVRRRARADARAEHARSRSWNEFEDKVAFLQAIGYLAPDHAFQAGARVLRHLQISEIFVSELVLDGVLEDLPASRLFGVLCGLTNSLPRHAHPSFRLRPEDRVLAKRIEQIRWSDVVTDAEQLSGAEVVWDGDVMHLGRGWADGHSLLDLVSWLQSDTDLSGDLVTGFRRAKDLAGQLRDVYADIPDRASMLAELVRRVSRDEVEVVG
ncbi:MAG: DEAD/DEAH box helicase [Myxococcota bacterium]